MIVSFDKNFDKVLSKIKDTFLLNKIEKVVLQCEEVIDIHQIKNLKKLVGYKNYYRIKIGDYRIGVEIIDKNIHFITIRHRKDIYKGFP